MGAPDRATLICPHCDNLTPHHRVTQATYATQRIEGGALINVRHWWAILECGTCKRLSLWADEPEPISLIHPDTGATPPEVPASIRGRFEEARRVVPRSRALAAVGFRRCLEALCADKGATSGPLATRIAALADAGAIPEQLAEMMNLSRVLANIGAHDDETEISPDDIATVEGFIRSLFEYVYVAPAQVEGLRKQIAARESG